MEGMENVPEIVDTKDSHHSANFGYHTSQKASDKNPS
jgi:hypothetical protein